MTARFNLKSKDWIHDPQRKRQFNAALFEEVASKYAFVTKALSLGQDKAWKRALIKELPVATNPKCVDLACGTGDLTFALADKYADGEVIGLDICEGMLSLAKELNGYSNVRFEIRDMCATTLEDHSVDIVTGGYALRNAPTLESALDEVARVLRPGGTAAFLDFSKPKGKVVQHTQHAILITWGSFWGLALHRNAEVYAYIAKSLQQFPDRVKLREMIASRGFTDLRARNFYFGALELLTFNAPR